MRNQLVLVGLVTSGLLACQQNDQYAMAESVRSSAAAQGADKDLSWAQRVLMAEASGDLAERARLAAAVDKSGTQDSLWKWTSGRLADRRGWKSVEESIQENTRLPLIDRYEQFRRGQPDDAQGHAKVALWCRQSGLDSQQSAHWRRVLQLDPNHRLARIALGHRLVNGTWVSPEELSRQQEAAIAMRDSLNKYGAKLMRLRREMMHALDGRRDAAKEEFFAIDSADAIPAVSDIFATAPRPVIEQAIQWLSYLPDPAAAEVLASWSIVHPVENVRIASAQGLARRPYHEYVPLLLERTRSPLVGSTMPVFRPDGSLVGVRQVYVREAKNNFEVAVVETLDVNPTPSQARSQLARRSTELRMRAASARAVLQNQRTAATVNVITERVNDRVRLALARSAGTASSAELPELWDWWADYTEREPEPIKPATYAYNLNPVASGCECFVAGTPVITFRGRKPIESLRVGDQVLSKNVETGELAWDVVVTTTRQPAQPLVMVRTDRDRFRCTGGHLFWVSGKGWTKARDLTDGDLLHGLEQPSVVDSVAESQVERTYNLVTQRHHNYFVGDGHLLSHDFAEQTPTAVRVPGLDYALHR